MQTITTPEGFEIVRTKAEDFKVGDHMLVNGGSVVTAVQHVAATWDQPRRVAITTRHPYGTSEILHVAWNEMWKRVA